MRNLLIATALATVASGCVHHYHGGPTEYREVRTVGYQYAGAHPSGGGDGWCMIEQQHVHDYAPDYSYYTYNGSYYTYSGPTMVYYLGYHPVPSGGYCNLNGRHSHRYHPGYQYADHYDYDNGRNTYVYRNPGYHGASPAQPPPGQGTGRAPPGYTSNNPPQQGYNPPPGHGGTPPGHGGTPPGHNAGHTPPGHINNPNANRPPPGYGGPPAHANNPGNNNGHTPPGHINNPNANRPPPGHGGPPAHANNPGNGHGNRPGDRPAHDYRPDNSNRPQDSGRPHAVGRPPHAGHGQNTIPAGGSNNGNRPELGRPNGGNHNPHINQPKREVPHKVDLPPAGGGRFNAPGPAPQNRPQVGNGRPAPGRPTGVAAPPPSGNQGQPNKGNAKKDDDKKPATKAPAGPNRPGGPPSRPGAPPPGRR